jgi:hypothetical protein
MKRIRLVTTALAAWAAPAAIASAEEAATSYAQYRLTAGGWAFMLLSVAFVWGLVIFCYRRVLAAPKETSESPDSLGD